MNNIFDLSIIMPILATIFILIITVVLIVVHGKTKQIQSQAINQKAFEGLVDELKSDNAIMKSELTTIKEDLNSINKMMKEIE